MRLTIARQIRSKMISHTEAFTVSAGAVDETAAWQAKAEQQAEVAWLRATFDASHEPPEGVAKAIPFVCPCGTESQLVPGRYAAVTTMTSHGPSTSILCRGCAMELCGPGSLGELRFASFYTNNEKVPVTT